MPNTPSDDAQIALDFVPLPFRTEPRTASAEGLDRLNREQGRKGVRAFEGLDAMDARLEQARAGYRRPSFTRQRLLTWVQHPDERVPMFLLRNEKEFTLDAAVSPSGEMPKKDWRGGEIVDDDHPRLTTQIMERAEREADEEGLIWGCGLACGRADAKP